MDDIERCGNDAWNVYFMPTTTTNDEELTSRMPSIPMLLLVLVPPSCSWVEKIRHDE